MRKERVTKYRKVREAPPWREATDEYSIFAMQDRRSGEIIIRVSISFPKVPVATIPVYSYRNDLIRETDWTHQRFTWATNYRDIYEMIGNNTVLDELKARLEFELGYCNRELYHLDRHQTELCSFLEFCEGCFLAERYGVSDRRVRGDRGRCSVSTQQLCAVLWNARRVGDALKAAVQPERKDG